VVNRGKHPLHVALVLRAKNGSQYFVDHPVSPLRVSGRRKKTSAAERRSARSCGTGVYQASGARRAARGDRSDPITDNAAY
jgi:hypothetical protein